MKKINKGKILLIILLIAIIATIAAISILKMGNKEPEQPEVPEEPPVIQLPDTTYSEMEVTNILIEYRKDNNETVLTFDIRNTTTKKVQNQFFKSVLIGPNEEVLAEMTNVHIQDLDVGQQHAVIVMYEGDLTATKQIKLIEK